MNNFHRNVIRLNNRNNFQRKFENTKHVFLYFGLRTTGVLNVNDLNVKSDLANCL